MRRIEFLAPVEAMRGNLSGSQKLTYPTQNNSAWDAPSDKRSYATNYNTRYVGAKRGSDGRKYFSVRTKSAVTMSEAMRAGMGLLAMSRIFAVNMKSDLMTLSQLQELFVNEKTGKTFTAWLQENIRRDIKLKSNAITFGQGTTSRIIYGNPFAITVPDGANNIFISNPDKWNEQSPKVFKFWLQLGPANAAQVPVYMPDGSKQYLLVNSNASFVDNLTNDRPVGWYDCTHSLYLGNGTKSGTASIASNPEEDSKVYGTPLGSLEQYVLYRRQKGEPASADVLVDAVNDTPEAGYIYTFKAQ